MTKVRITKKSGTDSRYYWLDAAGADRTHLTVYKETPEGDKRMRGVHFDAVANKIQRD